MEAVARVPIEETPEELQRLAASRHWTKVESGAESDLEFSAEK